jgi:glutathione synthase/RimK-type ligase-like ATP-grasp enzyme
MEGEPHMSKKVTIQIGGLSWQEPTVVIDSTYRKRWNIPDNIFIRFGSGRFKAAVVSGRRSDAVRLSPQIAQAAGLWPGATVRMQYRPGSRTLHLGPLIGVLLRKIGGTNSLFGDNTAFCKELSDACALYGACAIFLSPSDVSISSGTVLGWFEHNGWHRGTFPLPEIVYNRLTSRKYENNPSVQDFMREVKSHGGHVFNERYLDKTEVFQLLRKSAAVQPFLPESHSMQSFAMLQSMCRKYPIVFLKPIRGSLGKGIIRIIRKPEGGYSCQFATVNGTVSQNFKTLTALHRSIAGKLKSSRYQVQQGLNLITAGGRPMDFRALAQKDKNGKWQLTSIVARIAGNRHFVSNLARGGTLSPVQEALRKSDLGGGSGVVLARLKRAALAIAGALEQQVQEHFGELGIDLAVSKGGRVWLLEVNSKPSKNDNTAMPDQKIRPSVRQLILYCRHLAQL